MTLNVADWKLPPKKFAVKRKSVEANLRAFVPERFAVYVGVSKKIQVADGTEQGAMHPGGCYQIMREDFIKMKLDPTRSPFLLCLEPKVPCMYFEVCRALNTLYPQTARNTYLSSR